MIALHTNNNNLGQHCIDAFKETLLVSSIAFYHINDKLQPTDFILYHMSTTMHQDYLTKYHFFDPLSPNQCIKIDQPVVPLQLAYDFSASREKSLYQQFLAEHQIKDITEIIVTNTAGKPMMGISLFRHTQMDSFSVAELTTLTAMQTLLQKILVDYSPSLPYSQKLTDKEQDIILLLKKGLTNKELAQYLQVEVSTIKTHLNNLFRKCEVKTRSELISYLFLQ